MSRGDRWRLTKGSPDRIEARLRDVEAELERLLGEALAGTTGGPSLDPVRRRRVEQVVASFADRMHQRLESIAPPAEEHLVASALELLSPDHLLHLLGRFRMRHRSAEVDPFGMDPEQDRLVAPAIDFLYDRYFRVTANGAENIPRIGRCLLVSNRSGLLPWDALMIMAAVQREHPGRRRVRWLIEDFVYNQPFLGVLAARLGGVRACQENAERLLLQEELACVFPEGIVGAGKLFRDRYRLGRFGRGGYVRLVLRTGAPIVPVAVVGAEEVHPVLWKIRISHKATTFPFVPVTPTFPLLGPLGLVPVPTKWTIVFGEPIDFGHRPDDAENVALVSRLNERVRTNIQALVTDALGHRRSVLRG